jgi:DNA-damage-inducible protein D
VIEKAKKACENAGGIVSDHFADVGKMIELAKGAQREIEAIFQQ